jgi:DNA-binding Lrp family transcriptional regulator
MMNIITERDERAVRFIEDFGAASLSHIARAIYGNGKASLDVARRRLKVLTDKKLIKRCRNDMNAEYIYYSTPKPPARQSHHLILAGLYAAILDLTGEVEAWQREPLWNGLRPDAYCVFRGKKRIHFAIEIERNTNPFNQQKYEAFLSSGAYKQFFPSFPWVLIVAEKPPKLAPSPIKYIILPPSLNGLSNIFREV